MAWRPPRQGTKARRAMPRSAFLVPGQRKYPFKVKRGGRWVASPQGLMAAYKRASQQGNRRVRAEALRRLNPIRKRQGKPLLPR